MADPYNRIQQHLGIALRSLSLFDSRAAGGHDTPRDSARCLADLLLVAEELDHAFGALKSERQRLTTIAHEAETTMRRARKLFVQSPNACLVLLRDGAAIADANPAASRLLNMATRYLIGKPFTNFLHQDRDLFLRQLKDVTDEDVDGWQVTLRPRERAGVRVVVKAIADTALEDTAAIVLWPAGNGTAAEDATPESAES